MASAEVRVVAALTAMALNAAVLAPRAAEAAPSAGPSSSCGKGFIVYFSNGVRTTPDAALGSVLLTRAILGDSFNGEPIVDYRRALNATTGFTDFVRGLKQKLAETGASTYVISRILFDLTVLEGASQDPASLLNVTQQAALQNAFVGLFVDFERANGTSGGYFDANVAMHVQQYESDLADGQKVLVVAHSQGNLYANAAYDRLVTDGANMQGIAIASIASPADVAKSGEYVTSTKDVVISSLSQLFPTLAANVAVSYSWADDPLGHAYDRIYMNHEHEAFVHVMAMIHDLLARLQTSNPAPNCPDAGAPDAGAPDAGVGDGGLATPDAGVDACGGGGVPDGNRDNGAAANKYCNLLSPAEVSANVGVPGLTGPVILQSSTDVVAGSVSVEGATCAYASASAPQAVLISFEVTTPIPGTVQVLVTEAESGFSSAGCSVSSGASSFTAACPAGCGAPATNVVGDGVKETSYIQISSAYASQSRESTLLSAYAARLP
jgi:hypothetical protein